MENKDLMDLMVLQKMTFVLNKLGLTVHFSEIIKLNGEISNLKFRSFIGE